MKTRIITLVALVAVWLPARAIDNLTTLLPEDVTAFMSTKDAHFFEKLSEHPLAKAFGDSGLRKIFSPMLEKQKEGQEKMEKILKEETGMTIAEVNKTFNGGSTIGVKFDFAMLFGARLAGGAAEMPKGFFDMTLAMDFTGDEALAEKLTRAYARLFKESVAATGAAAPVLLAKFPEDYDASAEDYAGVKVHAWKLKKDAKSIIESPSYAVFDGALVFSLSEQGLRSAIDRVKKGAKSLADSPRHAALEKSAKESDFVSYFDLSTIIKSAMNMAAKEGGVAAGQTLTALRAIGVNKLDLLYLTADLSKGRSDFEFGLTFHDNPAFIKVIAMDGPGMVPNFLPPDADSGGHGTFYFDRALAAIESIMKDAVPAMGDLIATQLDELKKQTGVDIRKEIIANIGPDIFSATQPFDGKPSDDEEDTEPTVLGLKIKDRKALELAVTTLINKSAPDAALFEKREYQGVTIHNFKEAPVGYLFTDDWLVISMGPQTLLEKVITRMAKGGDDHLFAQPVVKSAFEGLPGDDEGSTYVDVGPTLDMLLELASGFSDTPGVDQFIKLDDLPKTMNLPIAIGMRQYLDDKAFRLRAHVIEKKK